MKIDDMIEMMTKTKMTKEVETEMEVIQIHDQSMITLAFGERKIGKKMMKMTMTTVQVKKPFVGTASSFQRPVLLSMVIAAY
jgi:hypothetical protein